MGPLDLLVMTGNGERRLRLRYRAAIARVAMNALHVLVEGQAQRLRTMKAEEPSAQGNDMEDQELIRAILDAREDE